MRMKKVYLNKSYDDGSEEIDWFYMCEEYDELSASICNLLVGRYVRSTKEEGNYVISSIDVCLEVER